MLISTRGRYAPRVLVDLAEQNTSEYIPLKEIAVRQHISQKYSESIMTLLSKAGMVEGIHGKGGGYRLSREPADYKIGDVLRLTEGTLAPVSCLECGSDPCERADECRTLPMWIKLDEMINDYLDDISVADLMKQENKGLLES